MKKLIVTLLVVALVFAVVGCGGSATTTTATTKGSETAAASTGTTTTGTEKVDYTGQTIVVQVWGGTYEETLRKYAIPMFEEQTGAKVDVLTGAAPLAQLATEGDKASVDVLHLDDAEIVSGKSMDIFETIDTSKLTNAPDLYEQAFKHDVAIVTNWGTYGLCYRTDLVKEAPTSWKDMWNAEFADGKLGFYDYTMGGGFETLDALCRMSGTTLADTANWDKLFADLKTLKPNIGLIFSSNDETVTQLTNGDIIMSTWTNGQAIRLKKAGVPVAYVMPEEGVPAMTSFTGIAKGSTKKDLAYIFADILLSTEVQKAYAENNYYAPSNSKTVISDELKAFMPYGEEQISKLTYLDSEALESVKKQLVEKWEQEFKN